MRHSRVAAIFGAVVTLLVALPQSGAAARNVASSHRVLGGNPRLVQTLNFVFIPDPTQAQLGQVVRWWNVTYTEHTTTGAAPLSLWDSGEILPKNTFDYTFTAAGIYSYLCTIHERYDMVSSVRVKDQADPPSGPIGTIFTITVATISAPVDYVYDVQKKNPDGLWKNWMMGVTSSSVQFDSTGFLAGTYGFRSRLHRLTDDARSGYSPAVSISVT